MNFVAAFGITENQLQNALQLTRRLENDILIIVKLVRRVLLSLLIFRHMRP